MDILHTTGIVCIHKLQHYLQNHNELMLFLSHIGDPRNAFLLYFPVVSCLHRSTGALLLWVACISEWLNGVLKWILHGERPYWWIKETAVYQGQTTPTIQQYRLTCETGPGSPSGHAMVTASVLLVVTLAITRSTTLRLYQKCICWCVYMAVISSVCISRCYIATHFPHQVLLGTIAGVFLTLVFEKIHAERLSLSQYCLVSISLPLSLLLVYVTIETSGIDPKWSIAKATKWCQEAEWIHLDTTVFNAIMRDGGALLGFGLFHHLSRRFHWTAEESTSFLTKVLQISVSLIICQIIEHLKPSQSSPLFYYLITYLKMSILVTMVATVASFPWRQQPHQLAKQAKRN